MKIINRLNASETIYSQKEIINQRIDMLLMTEKGTVLGDPLKGINAAIYDLPFEEARAELLRDLNEQLALYLSDIVVDKLAISYEDGEMKVDLSWSYKNGTIGEYRRLI